MVEADAAAERGPAAVPERCCIICIWSRKNCSGVKGGGIGILVPWLFCPCWPEPEPVFLVFTI